MICLTSLISLSAVSNIALTGAFQGHPAVALTWGIISFCFCLLVLILDRTQCFVETFNYTKAADGKVEGYALLALVVFWIVGVAFMTQVNGVGYLTLNIYFGSWLTLASCVYTLNEWSASKDILSIDELTGLSATLKSWYVLFLASLVVTGTSINYMAGFEEHVAQAALGLGMGSVSTLVSFAWILVHYRFITIIDTGGWIELGCCLLMVVCWIIGVAIVTQDGGVGATIVGAGCPGTIFDDYYSLEVPGNCTVVVYQNNNYTSFSCRQVLVAKVPGSNFYVFSWICLGSALNLCFRWKAQQALQFAQAAQQQKAAGKDEEDDLELDEFEDAAY